MGKGGNKGKIKETAKRKQTQGELREERESQLDAGTRAKVVELRRKLELVTRDRADIEARKSEAMSGFNNQLRGLDEYRKSILEEIDNYVMKDLPLIDQAAANASEEG